MAEAAEKAATDTSTHAQQVRVVHQAAAAAVSGNQMVAVVVTPQEEEEEEATDVIPLLAYASHALVYLAKPQRIALPLPQHQDDNDEQQQRRENTNTKNDVVFHVHQTLRTSLLETDDTTTTTATATVITALAVATSTFSTFSTVVVALLATGFSSGHIALWVGTRQKKKQENDSNHTDQDFSWTELKVEQEALYHSPAGENSDIGRNSIMSAAAGRLYLDHSITTLDVNLHHAAKRTAKQQRTNIDNDDEEEVSSSSFSWSVVAGNSAGATVFQGSLLVDSATSGNSTTSLLRLHHQHPLLSSPHHHHHHHRGGAISSVHFAANNTKEAAANGGSSSLPSLLFLGTAAPRHNKIHVFYYDDDDESKFLYAGALTGHEDWITDLAFDAPNQMLASASQDARIRLWKFRTTTTNNTTSDSPATAVAAAPGDGDSDSDADNDVLDEPEEEGEARLEIVCPGHAKNAPTTVTSISLEAILYGHEEGVTAVCWYPNPMPVYGVCSLLVSSSMDRTILLWAENDGVYCPISRVGSAGGILGGSMGSSLLGFCGVSVVEGAGHQRGGSTSLVGHGYGGILHVWDMETAPATSSEPLEQGSSTAAAASHISIEERAAQVKWTASPCVTGHFGGVTDLCWEAESGDYLLTVSNDQTCRLWAPVDGVWIELARPQVHGYDLSAVASMSTSEHRHLLVTGADEKELRAFDAPKSTLRILESAAGLQYKVDEVRRVDRAFIPSLGLSNKATAAEAAEEDKNGEEEPTNDLATKSGECVSLPLERELGAVSLWPEVQKLFGHNTEIYCLASTLSARTAGDAYRPSVSFDDVLVASSAKARNVEDAAIRLWKVQEGKCVQILSGGHKSTVATLSFSPDGRYLASSGKDRRLCLWKRQEDNTFTLAWAKDSAHKRIVWSVHFCPFQEAALASGSRDGCIKIWNVEDSVDGVQLVERFSFAPSFQRGGKPDAVTALAFAPAPTTTSHNMVLALGLESGRVEVWQIPGEESNEAPQRLATDLLPSQCHIATVTKLAWRPVQSPTDKLVLASCSMDHGCRIFEFNPL